MAYLPSLLMYIYGLFSPWSMATEISRYAGFRPQPELMAIIFATGVGLIIAGRRLWNALFLLYGGIVGYFIAIYVSGIVPQFHYEYLMFVALPLLFAVLFFSNARLLVSAAIAITAGSVAMSLVPDFGTAIVLSVIVFAVAYIFYRILSSLLAALLGSTLLLLFFIEMKIPYASPIMLSVLAFSVGMLLRFATVRMENGNRRVLLLNSS